MPLSQIKERLTQLNQRLDSARPAVQMWVFAAAGTLLTSLFFFLTRPAVEQHETQRLLLTLKELMPEKTFTPAALEEAIDIRSVESGLSKLQLYRLREGETVHALLLKATTPKGYSGDIEFAMVVRPDGQIVGVRVLRHRETPGLGDWIETARSSWIRAFEGKSLEDPIGPLWHVKKDGGIFDQFTGATVTPRAVVKGVHETLKTLEANGATRKGP
jgi:electron transport complex protein RnfG